jgi:hypothetical protein
MQAAGICRCTSACRYMQQYTAICKTSIITNKEPNNNKLIIQATRMLSEYKNIENIETESKLNKETKVKETRK